MDFPATGAFGTGTTGDLTAAEAAALHNQVLAACRQLPGAQVGATLTISSGTITPTCAVHAVDTEGAAAADDLVKLNIASIADGHVLVLRAANITRVVTVKSQAAGVGQIVLAGNVDFVMNAAHRMLVLYRDGNLWREVTRVTHLPTGEPHGKEEFTASGTFTVPEGVDNVWVTLVGGGGGGGGGAGSNGDAPNTGGDGGNGGSGGNSSFGSFNTAGGGGGGLGGKASGPGGGDGGDATAIYGGKFKGAGERPILSPLGTYGQGGRGGSGASNAVSGGGGGGAGTPGAFVMRHPVANLKPAQTIAVTVGAGGTAGAAGTGTSAGAAGSAGSAGKVIVEW